MADDDDESKTTALALYRGTRKRARRRFQPSGLDGLFGTMFRGALRGALSTLERTAARRQATEQKVRCDLEVALASRDPAVQDAVVGLLERLDILLETLGHEPEHTEESRRTAAVAAIELFHRPPAG